MNIIYDQTQWESAVKAVKLMRVSTPEELDGASRYEIWSANAAKERFLVADDDKVSEREYMGVKGAVSMFDLQIYSRTSR